VKSLGVAFAFSRYCDSNQAETGGLSIFKALNPELCVTQTLRGIAPNRTARLDHRLRQTIVNVAVARLHCSDVNGADLEAEALVLQIEARAKLLTGLAMLREQIMHERFGSLSLGRLRERRRRQPTARIR
jgi:hypothetical protein